MDDVPVVEFADAVALRAWLEQHHATSAGVWLRLYRKDAGAKTVSFQEVLEAGLCYGRSESTRRALDDRSYLQRFTPRRTTGTTSARNRILAAQLIAGDQMTAAGRAALGLDPMMSSEASEPDATSARRTTAGDN